MRFPEWSVSPSHPSEGVDCYWIMNGAMLVGSVDGPQSDQRQEQRAHLIAAAPDMYEALDALLLQSLQSTVADAGNEYGGEAIEQAKAALAKARGETTT